METKSDEPAGKRIYVTRTGLPLTFKLDWPFRKSSAGADFYYMHTDIQLENSAGLHALVAVNLSATVREIMPSLEPKDAEGPVINSLRKEVDKHQLEFLKSSKLVPVHFSSRHWDFNRNKWIFGKASEEDMALLLSRKAYWQSKAGGAAWVGDPTEAQYLEATVTQVLETAGKLNSEGLIKLDGEYAAATPALLAQAEKFESDMRNALRELEEKHAFERGQPAKSA